MPKTPALQTFLVFDASEDILINHRLVREDGPLALGLPAVRLYQPDKDDPAQIVGVAFGKMRRSVDLLGMYVVDVIVDPQYAVDAFTEQQDK